MAQSLTDTKDNFNIGDLVFAKVRGYSHWSSKISGVEKTKNSTKYNVVFFGPIKETALVNKCYICLYKENKNKYGQFKVENFKNANFNAAIKEAESVLNQDTSHACNETSGVHVQGLPEGNQSCES
ncbi:PC4 and SFRS1-interacting protein [Homalodisca vitripennis]|nr:PC4 and SFRS1-interacting protein [Homalodisca vitripennis]